MAGGHYIQFFIFLAACTFEHQGWWTDNGLRKCSAKGQTVPASATNDATLETGWANN